MKIVTRNTVTCGGWNVSTCTPPMSGERGSELRVFKLHTRYHHSPGPQRTLFQYGDGNGRIFPTSDAAFAWAREHGYLTDYRSRIWCRTHRRRHFFLGRPTSWCTVTRCVEFDVEYVPMWQVKQVQARRSR